MPQTVSGPPYIVSHTQAGCAACGQELTLRDGGSGPHWYGHGDSEEPGHEGGGPDETPWCLREEQSGGATGASPDMEILLSRVAVRSLEEAHEAAWAAVPAKFCAGTVLDAIRAIPESGGSVSLPDGTRVEVRATTWMALNETTDAIPMWSADRPIPDDVAERRILAAWNEEHGR